MKQYQDNYQDIDIPLGNQHYDSIINRLTLLEDKVNAIHLKLDLITTAFSKNDLGTPDFDGHRKEHISMEKTKSAFEGYKEISTRRLLNIIISGVVILFIGGIVQWIKTVVGK